jgi:predicted Zn-dependent peptidase
LEDSKDIAGLFVEDLLLENKIRTYDQIIKGVEKVGLDDLKKVAKQVFVNKGLNLAVIGPYKTKDKFSKILKL